VFLRISPNGKRLAWVDHYCSVCLWNLENGREVPFLGPPLVFGWHNLAFYPDSDHLTFGAARGMVETWDTRTARRVSSFGRAGFQAASPDGRWLATTADPSTVSLWSSQTGSQVFSLPPESGPIWSLAWSPDDERLAVGLADGGLAIWNVPKIQAELTRISLAWRADARPQQQEPQPFVPATPQEQEHQIEQYSNLAKRLASVGRLAEAAEVNHAAVQYLAKASAANPKDTILSLKLAALQAWFGQEKELAATRKRILVFAKGTSDSGAADHGAKACSILPSPDKAELEAALALGRKAVELGKGGQWQEWNLLALGMAEYRSGNYAAAIEALLAAEKAGPKNALATGTAAFYRAMSLFRKGKPDEARLLASEAVSQMKPLPKDEQNPLANSAGHDDLILWLAYMEAKDLIKFDAAPASAERLRVVLQGEASPRDNAERLSLARMCEESKRFAAAARLTAEALESDPKLGDNHKGRTRHQATGRAVLAGVGQGEDDPRPDEAARKRLRTQARDWFRADLGLYSKTLETGKADDRRVIAKHFQHWKVCPDLGPVRDSEALKKLPEAERKEWQALWGEVETSSNVPRKGKKGTGSNRVRLDIAIAWLRADLALHTAQLGSGQLADRTEVQQKLKHWQQESDLAGLRDKDALAKLPADERASCEQFWADVAAFLKKTER
jgi:tetratricopeptide (TPR) repeat protein